MRSLNFRINNSGGVPAEDVILFIDFPDQFHFPLDQDLLEYKVLSEESPEPPRRPSPYSSIIDGIQGISANQLLNRYSIPPVDLSSYIRSSDSNVKGPFIRRKNSTEVRYEITKLMHGFIFDLDSVEFIISEEAIGQLWELPFRVYASNLPSSISGTLLVDVRQENTT